jgi:hypothetical protein
MDAIVSNPSATADKLFSISSLAVALRHILGSLDSRDEQPLLSAIELCSMIEEIAQEEGGRLSD